MGLDQVAYCKPADAKDGKTLSDDRIGEWRKHPNLQGWMERLWRTQKYGDSKNPDPKPGEGYSNQTYMGDPFNQEEVELNLDDIKRLRLDINNKTLNGGYGDTTGFFFGDSSDEFYRETDIKFCDTAEYMLNNGYKVIYYSWW